MKIIQIRGSHGSGKSTAIKQYMEHGGFVESSVSVHGAPVIIYTNGDEVVIGKYGDAATGGIDGYITDRAFLKETIARTVREFHPKKLFFEGVFYGKTFQFGKELKTFADAKKAEYIAVVFVPSLQTTIERVTERNGGKAFNVDALQKTYFAVISSAKKLQQIGVDVRWIDTGKIERERMWEVLEKV